MKALLIMLTILVILVCLTIRTDAFNPEVIEYRWSGFAKPDLRGWPEVVLLFLILLIGCICLAPFFDHKNRL